ncbi:MAG: hypothetical protein GXX94_04105 [Chloroflexi bacterium]|nr:hypothetical protein [Chloroflexota bacterium]
MVLAAVRDVAIVLLALISIVIGVLLVLLLVQIRNLVRTLREEVAPILKTTQTTASRLDGTVHLVSDTVVSPLIKVNSYAAGVRQALGTLRGPRRRSSRATAGGSSTPVTLHRVLNKEADHEQ